MYPIIEKKTIAPSTIQMVIQAPRVAKKILAGQFIILRPFADSERIPLTCANAEPDAGTVTVIFQTVGVTTRELASLEVGEALCDLVGPLGKASLLDTAKRVLCIGGGVGAAVVFPQVKMLHQRGAHVDVIIGARSKEFVILEDEIRANCTNLYITTDDGSYVRKGFVTDVAQELLSLGNQYDEVLAIGPAVMMRAVVNVTRQFGVKTTVSLNPIMVDGTGMCGGCRVTVGGKTMYACVDGPDFDGFEVEFDELMLRQRMYREEEAEMNEKHPCGGAYHGR